MLLKKITFEAKRGQLVAIVGKIGSGKTSLLALLTRLAEFASGEICVNGTDIREFSAEGLRARLGLVTQDPFILTDTVLNNITLGREGLGKDAVENACAFPSSSTT
jgi:ABC-type multidrug transport system fused ATPase/permease subunit